MIGPDQPYQNSHKVNTQTLGARICTKKSRFKASRLQTKVETPTWTSLRPNEEINSQVGSTGNPVTLEATQKIKEVLIAAAFLYFFKPLHELIKDIRPDERRATLIRS